MSWKGPTHSLRLTTLLTALKTYVKKTTRKTQLRAVSFYLVLSVLSKSADATGGNKRKACPSNKWRQKDVYHRAFEVRRY